jgi:hypothetical protein
MHSVIAMNKQNINLAGTYWDLELKPLGCMAGMLSSQLYRSFLF